MKKIYQYTLSIVALVFLVIACTKEITDDLVVFFKVEFSETTIDAFLNTRKASEFTIIGGGEVIAGDYQIKYNVTEGAGSYFVNTIEVVENQFIDLPEGPEYTIEYLGTNVGANKVTLTLRDRSGREEEFVLTYDVKDTAFTFDVVTNPESAYVSGIIDLNLSLEEINSATYEISYVFNALTDPAVQGTASVSVENEVFEPETIRPISIGDSSWEFEGLTLGTVEILFTVTSSLGVSVEKVLQVEVTDTPDFTFTAALGTDTIFSTNSGAAIDFTITEIMSMSTYVMNYTSSNSGSITYNGETFQPGDNIPVQVGSSVGTYIGTVEGEHILEFVVNNANTITISREASLTLNYRDPDGNPPVIELVGDAVITLNIGETFSDPGATATDDIDGDLTSNITVTGTVNVNVVGTYTLVYSVNDSSGNTSSVERVITVIDNIPPVLTILGDNPLIIIVGNTFSDPGATATDNVDGDLTSQIEVAGTVDINTPGDYVLTYSVIDASSNSASITRTVTVVNDQSPVLVLNGANPFIINVGVVYTDPGATATDTIDGDLTSQIEITGSVDVNTPGEYIITYSVTDSSSNTSTLTRTVQVVDNVSPVVTLNGANPLSINTGEAYVEPGATATDNVDGDLSSQIGISGTVNINVPGDYSIVYSVTDTSNNTTTVTRIVKVIDNIAPVILLNGSSMITLNVGDVFSDPGATATDNVDGDITSLIVAGGTFVNTNTAGTFTITYDVTDSSNNPANRLTRTILVETTTSFNRATGLLTATPGALVLITMTSGGSGTGNAVIRAGTIALGITCWGLSPGTNCLLSPDDTDPEVSEAAFEFTMPAGGEILITGSHSANGGDFGNGTSFSIGVDGQNFSGSMTEGNDIPQ